MDTLSQNKKGFTLLEVSIYIAILTVVSIGAVTLLLSLNDLYQVYRTQKVLFDTSVTVMERIGTEIRSSESVDGSSVALVPNGQLALDQNGSIVDFSISGNELHVGRDSIDEGSLTPTNVTTDYFYVYQYSSSETELVRVRVGLTASTTENVVSMELDFAANLRGSYAQ